MSKFYARQVVSDYRAAKSKFVALKSTRSLLFGTTSLLLKVTGNRESEGESFCIEYIVADMGFRIFCHARRWTTCVQQKFGSVCLHVIKKHRNKLLFSYYELGFRCFELNLFSHGFASVRFEKFKPEQALRTLDWKDSLFTVIHLIWPKPYIVSRMRTVENMG